MPHVVKAELRDIIRGYTTDKTILNKQAITIMMMKEGYIVSYWI